MSRFIVLLAAFFPFIGAMSQGTSVSDQGLTIEWQMAEDAYKKMKRKTLVEFEFQPAAMKINGEEVSAVSAHTRGKTSKKYWRKSYTISLEDKFSFSGSIAMKKFYLLSMSMDRNYLRNRLAFDCLSPLGVFPLWYQYVTLGINNRPEGLYMLVQRPADYALKESGSHSILRRQTTGLLAKEKFDKDISDEDRKLSLKTFESISKDCAELSGKDLFESLNVKLDMQSYFRWLAFNYLVRNGDYTDEVFYYALQNSDPVRFGIIPWDFDDILAKGPHEGAIKRAETLGDQLLFSSEDKLDRTIANDPYLYKRYLEEMATVCEVLTPKTLKGITDNIFRDLRSYFLDDNVATLSQHDKDEIGSLKELREELTAIHNYLCTRRRMMMRLARHTSVN